MSHSEVLLSPFVQAYAGRSHQVTTLVPCLICPRLIAPASDWILTKTNLVTETTKRRFCDPTYNTVPPIYLFEYFCANLSVLRRMK